MSLIATFPGKLGDALHQWPVMYRYCVEHNTRCTLWLDEKTCAPLVKLFECQPVVEKVELKPGIQHWQMGGQPWDFGLQTQDHLDHQIFHLGLRNFPSRQLTLQCLNDVPFKLKNIEALTQEPSLFVPDLDPKPLPNRLVLHGNFSTHGQAVPSFWRFLSDIAPQVIQEFDHIYFVGTTAEVERALEIYPDWLGWPDGGDLTLSAQCIAGADLMIGCGSSMVALAGQLKTPCIRVHDPIGDHSKSIWSNLGPNQWNETERDLRKMWPEILAAVKATA